MKFGLITYEDRPGQRKEQCVINIGNYFEWIAIEHLYKTMGIPESDIVRMSSTEMKHYTGDPLILPMNYILSDNFECVYMENGRFAFPEAVKPVFLGISFLHAQWTWTEEKIAYLKRFSPIGCRDYYTYETLKGLGVDVYLAGCITATLPLREEQREYNKVFFSEVPASIKRFVPDEVWENAVFRSQQVNLTEEQFADPSFGYAYSKERLKEYRDHASLIVTSRLHGALPCMAMGIPVIIVKEYFGHPFDLVPRFAPLYTYREYQKIDWRKKPADMERYKKVALKCAVDRLLDSPSAEASIAALHREYADMYADGYTEGSLELDYFRDELKQRFQNKSYEYALWGLSKDTDAIRQMVEEFSPEARLVKIIDTFKDTVYCGIRTEKPDVLYYCPNLVVFVTTLNCSTHAYELFHKMNKPPETYLCVGEEILKHAE